MKKRRTVRFSNIILNKALNNRMADPSAIFIDRTHIKSDANKKKYQKQKAAETAKVYTESLPRGKTGTGETRQGTDQR